MNDEQSSSLPVVRPRDAGARRGDGPRNFLSRREYRRIFWVFMPPAMVVMLALGWVERAWFGRPPSPTPPQVDTRMTAIRGEAPDADSVMIEMDRDGEAVPPAARGLAASAEALAKVRDDTVFRAADEDAWFQILTTLRSAEAGPPSRSAAQAVSFAELFGQPKSFRGRLVTVRGTLRRLEKLAAQPNPYGFADYWQGWLEPEGGPPSPIVVYFLQVPPGMPEGQSIREPVEVVGYFFKRWAYAATDTVRLAPLVLALEPSWRQRPAGRRENDPIGTAALITMVAVVLLTLAGIRAAGGGPTRRRPMAEPHDLASALDDAEARSTEESLRRLADASRNREP